MEKGKKVKSSKKAGFRHREARWKQQLKQIENVTSEYATINHEEIERFSDIPLSGATMEGLMKTGYANPTDIQKVAIPLALQGKDVLGAAKTGSGKTLAFLIPILELLWRERWSQVDGLGALIISPTRELAYQTFEVLRKIGASHDFSAGLVIGGHELASERRQIQRTNIIICTPGRLLQHMDETPDFQCSGLKILVLDETDRILDLGFRQAMNNIVDNLPTDRQTLLFSATQTKSVKDLAMLSLNDPEYVSVHEESHTSTPHNLSQSYIVCELQDKLPTLFSFIKSHLTSKTIVFMSSCKQVKFVYEAFRRFRPGVPLMALYGKQKQVKRVAIYNDFCRKKAAVLFCTDIASRGLDFPSIEWVIQLDCPEDANTYIHRVGRTARYKKDGQALLVLLPSEEAGMLTELKARKIPIECIKINPSKMLNIQGKLNAFCAQDVQMKQWAQRSFICYVRSIYLQSNKKVFDVRKLPLEEYALALGLPQAPKVRFLKKGSGKKGGNRGQRSDEESPISDEDEGQRSADKDGSEDDFTANKKLLDAKTKKTLSRIPTSNSKKLKKLAEDDILTVKRVIMYGNKESDESDNERSHSTAKKPTKPKTKFAIAKKLLNKGINPNQHITFDSEEEEEVNDASLMDTDNMGDLCPIPLKEYEKETSKGKKRVGGISIKRARQTMEAADKEDKQRERNRVREEHLKRRRKEKQQQVGEAAEQVGMVTLGDSDDGEEQRTMDDPILDSAASDDDEEEKLKEDEELAMHLLQS